MNPDGSEEHVVGLVICLVILIDWWERRARQCMSNGSEEHVTETLGGSEEHTIVGRDLPPPSGL